jgi:hypothetical protein
MVIRRVEPLSCAKVTGVLYVILGLVVGAGISFFSSMASMAGANPRASAMAGVFGMGAIIFLPILYGIAGFVTTLIGAWLYNLVAGIVGGIELDLQ